MAKGLLVIMLVALAIAYVHLANENHRNALTACADNSAYTRGMLVQCISDYWNSTASGNYDITEACVQFTLDKGTPSEVLELVNTGKAEC
jgi:hypothetical protein